MSDKLRIYIFQHNLLQSRWHFRNKKKFSLTDFITAVTVFRCPASWGGHSFSLDIGVPLYTTGQAKPSEFLWIHCLLNKDFNEGVSSQREDWLQLLIWLQGCWFFIACPLENYLMGPSVFTNDTAECHGPEQCRNSKGLLTFLYHFGAGCSAMPELITRAQLTLWSSQPSNPWGNKSCSLLQIPKNFIHGKSNGFIPVWISLDRYSDMQGMCC